MQCNRVWRNSSFPNPDGFSAGILRVSCASILLAACLTLPQRALGQQDASTGYSDSLATGGVVDGVAAPGASEAGAPALPATLAEMNQAAEAPAKPEMELSAGSGPQVKEVHLDRPEPMKQEIIIEGLMSYGNYKIFASGYDEKLFTGGVEYNRHSWGHFLGGEMDYVAEVLPFVLLDKPRSVDNYGNPRPISQKNIREYVPGVGFSPIGFRLQWRSAKRIRPYLEAKGGVLVFTKKVPSTNASYENFSLQSATGLQVMLNQRWGLRLGVFSDFHFSNSFVVPINPGLDVMNANLGLSYHF